MNQQQLNPEEILAQFGDQAPAIQQLLQALMAPLQNQINQLQGQLAQVPIGNVQPQPQPHPREPKVADPPIFSGDRTQVESFLRAVHLCFQLTPSRFPEGDEQRRILFALGFVREGTAGTWANNLYSTFLDPNQPNPFLTFMEFQRAFERAFGNADRAQKARTDMATLKMKLGDTVEEYTTSFEALAGHTGYNEAAHVEAYRSGLHHRIVEKIYGDTNGELPVNLAAWKTKARRLDNLHLEYKALQSRIPQTSSGQQKPRSQFTRAPGFSSTSTTSTFTPTPTHDAMDVDSHRKTVRCYNCNKFGHIARNCPEPKRFRSIRASDLAEAIRAVLAETSTSKIEEVAEKPQDFPNGQQ